MFKSILSEAFSFAVSLPSYFIVTGSSLNDLVPKFRLGNALNIGTGKIPSFCHLFPSLKILSYLFIPEMEVFCSVRDPEMLKQVQHDMWQ